MHLRETEGIAIYDFNRLIANERRLTIDTNVPLELWVTVEGLDVTAEVFDVVGSQRVGYAWGGVESRNTAQREITQRLAH